MNAAQEFKNKIASVIETIDALGKDYKFATEENREDFLELKEALVIGLDEVESLVDGDEALRLALE